MPEGAQLFGVMIDLAGHFLFLHFSKQSVKTFFEFFRSAKPRLGTKAEGWNMSGKSPPERAPTVAGE